MPQYDYQCRKCRKKFTLVLTVSEHDRKKPRCPKCKSQSIKPVFSGFTAMTSKKS